MACSCQRVGKVAQPLQPGLGPAAAGCILQVGVFLALQLLRAPLTSGAILSLGVWLSAPSGKQKAASD
jgi:hypothetical protein